MAQNSSMKQVLYFILIISFNVCLAIPGFGYGFGLGWGGGSDYNSLSPSFYDYTCPQANDIVISVLDNAIAQDPRNAAALLRLHFHDCFVQVCTLLF